MKVLVTGGFGYLGARLAQLLSDAGHDVVLGSREARCVPSWLPTARVARTEFSDPASLLNVCREVDAVAHLSGMNADDCAADPAAALAANGVATGQLARSAARAGVTRFLYLSTAHVYGSPLQGHVDEGTELRATHPYATSHRAGEDQVRWLHGRELTGIVVRLSNAFGAPVHPTVNCWMLALNDLCLSAVRVGTMAVRSGGHRRDFIPLAEAARAVAHLLRIPGELCGDGVFNVGSGKSRTVLDMANSLADRLALVMGSRPIVTAGDHRESESFSYDRRKLLDSGFIPSSEDVTTAELDGLARFCVANHKAIAA